MGNPDFILGGRSWERERADEDEEAEGKNQKKMGGEVLKDHKLRQQPVCLSRRAILWAFYSIVLLFLLRSYLFQESPLPSSRKLDHIDQGQDDRDHRHHHRPTEPTCDLAQGQWVHDASPPTYNHSTCKTIKEGQNCIAHGRPDTGYLHWRWQPHNCTLPRFDPSTFLSLTANQKLIFVGDSMARNQLESLLCLLSQHSEPKLTHSDHNNKFRTWVFPSHNLTVSVLWSPFQVKGVEKNGELNYNKLYLDVMDARWGRELNEADIVVLSVGHWFLHPALFFEGGEVVGCHHCPGMNQTEIGFYGVLRKVLRTSLRGIMEARRKMNVVVTTFSPAHFDGEWDKAGACDRKEPYRMGEKELGWMDAEMRKIEVEEVESLRLGDGPSWGLRVEALDVTGLAMMRPDAHPGPYMHPFPFAGGLKERVQNDCVHWCLPGAIDTWNEIMLEMMRRWRRKDERQ